MTDKELKTFFDSIPDFSSFYTRVSERKDIFLKDGFSIAFQDDLQPPAVQMTVNHRTYSFDDLAFTRMLEDMIAEKKMLEKEEASREAKLEKASLTNEIFRVENNVYRVHKEYIDHMLLVSDIGSTHSLYLKKLGHLMGLFNRDSILMINEHKIRSVKELKVYLKSAGFYFIDKDIH